MIQPYSAHADEALPSWTFALGMLFESLVSCGGAFKKRHCTQSHRGALSSWLHGATGCRDYIANSFTVAMLFSQQALLWAMLVSPHEINARVHGQ